MTKFSEAKVYNVDLGDNTPNIVGNLRGSSGSIETLPILYQAPESHTPLVARQLGTKGSSNGSGGWSVFGMSHNQSVGTVSACGALLCVIGCALGIMKANQERSEEQLQLEAIQVQGWAGRNVQEASAPRRQDGIR